MSRLPIVVSAEQLDDYDPACYDAILNDNGTYTLYPLLWWDDKSYAEYQGDSIPGCGD